MKSSSTNGTMLPSRPRAAQYFLRDSVRHVLGLIGLGDEHDHAQRVAMLPADQVGDRGFIVGAVEVGLRECRSEPAKMIDDNIKIFRRRRNNRGPFTHTQLPCHGLKATRTGLGLGLAFLAWRVCLQPELAGLSSPKTYTANPRIEWTR